MTELLILVFVFLAVVGAFHKYRNREGSPVVLMIGALALIVVLNALGY